MYSTQNVFQDFYNYFQHGLDFFISGSTHTVKKIIIHSNIASSIPLSEIHQSNGTKTAWISTLPTVQAMQLGNRRRTRRRRRRSVFQNSMFHSNIYCWIDTPPRKRFYDRFETISHFLSPKETPPSMVLNRTDDEDGLQLPNATTRCTIPIPFLRCKADLIFHPVYGYDGIILEVLESSQVVSVTLF